MKSLRAPIVFGSADGLTVALGIVLSLAAAAPGAVVKGALGAGLAELVGMTAGQWLSDGDSGFAPALGNGTASLTACFIPAVPYLVTSGTAALVASMILVLAIGVVLAWLRPEKGTLAYVQTFGVLVVAAVLCFLASLI